MTHQLTPLEFIITERLENWAGWPDPDWLVDTIRRLNWKPEDIRKAMLALRDKGVIAFVQHKDQTVVRME